MKKKQFLTEAKRKEIIADKERVIIESFAKMFNRIKRIDENAIGARKFTHPNAIRPDYNLLLTLEDNELVKIIDFIDFDYSEPKQWWVNYLSRVGKERFVERMIMDSTNGHDYLVWTSELPLNYREKKQPEQGLKNKLDTSRFTTPSRRRPDYNLLLTLNDDELVKIIDTIDGPRDKIAWWKDYLKKFGKEQLINKMILVSSDGNDELGWAPDLPMEYRENQEPAKPRPTPQFTTYKNETLTIIQDDIFRTIHSDNEAEFLDLIKNNIDDDKKGKISDEDLKNIFNKLKSNKPQHAAYIAGEIEKLLGAYITTEK